MKKLTLFFMTLIFLFSCRMAFASVVINEIMYNPTQDDAYNEWIELYNTDSSQSQDLTNLTLCGTNVKSGYIEKGASSASSDNGMVLGAGQYAIITDGGSGTQAYDNFSIPTSALALHADSSSICGGLSNTGATVTLGGSATDSVTYTSSQGGNGDGNSLQLVSGSWLGATPTPGSQNQGATTSTSSPSQNIGGPLVTDYSPPQNTTTTTNTTNDAAQSSQITTKITGNNFAFAGITTELRLTAFGYGGEALNSGRFFLNFGDGDSKEITGSDLATMETIQHTYFYPGNYILTLEYYLNSYSSSTPDATDGFTINVVPNDISISKVGDNQDFFIELTNNTAHDADLSGWVLLSNTKSFTLPQDTTIQSKNNVILSSQITGFSAVDEGSLKLMSSENKLVFDYVASVAPPIPNPVVKNAIVKEKVSSAEKNSSSAEEMPEIPAENIPILNLTSNQTAGPAAVVSSNVVNQNSISPSALTIIAIIFIGASASAIYFIRRKKITNNPADNFNILEE